jgi:hypothetical protein
LELMRFPEEEEEPVEVVESALVSVASSPQAASRPRQGRRAKREPIR